MHVAITCPPILHPCYMGVDMGRYDDLIANQRSQEEIRAYIQADSLTYLSMDGMMRAVNRGGYCQACFNGEYPIQIDAQSVKTGFERNTR